jgi:hypothetical protein
MNEQAGPIELRGTWLVDGRAEGAVLFSNVGLSFWGGVDPFTGTVIDRCMVTEPLIPVAAQTIMTNSGKYAHYGPGLVGRGFRFGSLAACVDVACAGRAGDGLPGWLC